MSDGQSRIAIKFGAPLSGTSKKAQRPPPPPSTLGKRHRHRFNADSESEGEDETVGRHESITGFGADGAEVEDARSRQRREAQERSETQRRGKRDRSEESKSRQNTDLKETDPPDEDKPIKWGLTLTKKSSQNADADQANGNSAKEDDQKTADETGPPKSADEQALNALLGKADSSSERRGQRTEDDAYRDATDNAPDVDPLKIYDDHPVEGFGASLLKGQGWDGKMRGPKTKEVKRRPNQMGLGAKSLNGAEDLGDWNHKGSRDKRPRLDEYKREREKERSRRDDQYRDSYKRERDRERERDRDRDRDRGSDYRHRDRDYRR
ncbi:putative pre-mrna-splicing factor spp2 protein [Phaeoacremonium minimum UCRPA7]|uniref:Pre-mRNA-splicing factor n=1 Tax=Phaeoacremonium minimum (strain UCR-PA7) TaxID=1286976 RepID=R8BTT9_PHAM7|nr:putative pre-mrna-splicing factor spp2 protein [Phaeoacremonium minimum UCRPA7]EOO02803.1 putative pre-mrna-splicing factor spp2 protein [Phaeoacremonium minimum UCRPA7]